MAGATVSATEVCNHAAPEYTGQPCLVVQVLRAVPVALDFGVCQMCLHEPADAVIGGQPWCRRCRDRFEIERPRGPFME